MPACSPSCAQKEGSPSAYQDPGPHLGGDSSPPSAATPPLAAPTFPCGRGRALSFPTDPSPVRMSLGNAEDSTLRDPLPPCAQRGMRGQRAQGPGRWVRVRGLGGWGEGPLTRKGPQGLLDVLHAEQVCHRHPATVRAGRASAKRLESAFLVISAHMTGAAVLRPGARGPAWRGARGRGAGRAARAARSAAPRARQSRSRSRPAPPRQGPRHRPGGQGGAGKGEPLT